MSDQLGNADVARFAPAGGGCAIWREAISARIDGQEAPAEAAALDVHVQHCESCRAVEADMVAVTRLMRVRGVEDDVDLTAAVLAAWDGGDGYRVESGRTCGEGIYLVGAVACGCAATCDCGCQQGGRCGCGTAAA